jgi:hypothetical protein
MSLHSSFEVVNYKLLYIKKVKNQIINLILDY